MEATVETRKDEPMAEEIKPDHSVVLQRVEKYGTEIRQLKELQAEIAKRHAEQRAADEAEKKSARDAIAKKQNDAFSQLLQLQVQEAQSKQKRDAMLNKLLAALLAVATSGGGAGIYLASQKPTEEERAREAAPVTEAVAKESNEVEARVEKNAKKIERLGEIAVEQQVQLSDGVQYIGSKIDAAHPRQRNDVEQPDSVKAAKRKADKIKQRKGAEELFKDEDDPFAGL
jgi:hypothetical protein